MGQRQWCPYCPMRKCNVSSFVLGSVCVCVCVTPPADWNLMSLLFRPVCVFIRSWCGVQSNTSWGFSFHGERFIGCTAAASQLIWWGVLWCHSVGWWWWAWSLLCAGTLTLMSLDQGSTLDWHLVVGRIWVARVPLLARKPGVQPTCTGYSHILCCFQLWLTFCLLCFFSLISRDFALWFLVPTLILFVKFGSVFGTFVAHLFEKNLFMWCLFKFINEANYGQKSLFINPWCSVTVTF